MSFDLIDSTTRSGVIVDEVEFEVHGAPPATGYLLGRDPNQAQSVVLALHDERGDKASLLPDLERLAGKGFLCLSVDSPMTRQAAKDRDPASAFEHQFSIATAAIDLLLDHAEISNHRVAVIGRDLGAEVAACLAAGHPSIEVGVAIGGLLDRSRFIRESDHPLAAGIRVLNDPADRDRIISKLGSRRLRDQLDGTPATHWLVQIADDDDRVTDDDRSYLQLRAPHTVSVESYRNRSDFATSRAAHHRIDFISRLCP